MNPLLSIWNNPRSTIRSILDKGSIASFFPLTAIWGVWRCLSQSLKNEIPNDDMGATAIIGINVIFGVIFGIVVCSLFALIIRYVAKLFSSRATLKEVFIVIGWSSVPAIPILIALFVVLAIAGEDIIFGSIKNSSDFPLVVYISVTIYALLGLIFAIWSIIITVIGLSEAAGIGVGRSVAAYLISGIILIAICIAPIIGFVILTTE